MSFQTRPSQPTGRASGVTVQGEANPRDIPQNGCFEGQEGGERPEVAGRAMYTRRTQSGTRRICLETRPFEPCPHIRDTWTRIEY